MATADRKQPDRPQDASDAPEPQVIILEPDTSDPDETPPHGAADLLDDDIDADAQAEIDKHGRRLQPAHEFLVPGPDAASDSGTLRWGLTWIVFSLLLILFMLGVSFVCWLLASWTGLA